MTPIHDPSPCSAWRQARKSGNQKIPLQRLSFMESKKLSRKTLKKAVGMAKKTDEVRFTLS